MSKSRIWCSRVACLMIASLFFIAGRSVDASTSTQVFTKQVWSFIIDQTPASPEKLDWAIAQRKRERGSLSPEEKNRVRQWKQMSPEERQRYQERYQRWKQMSPQERKRYQQGHQQWNQLSPKERKQIQRKLERWDKLSPQERESIRRWFKN